MAHNRIEDVPYTGIWGESPRGLRVVGNVVRDAVREVPDGGGIYLPFAQGPSFGPPRGRPRQRRPKTREAWGSTPTSARTG